MLDPDSRKRQKNSLTNVYRVVYSKRMKAFGTFIRQRREDLLAKDRRYSLRQVAARIGVQPSYLSKVERGEQPPPSEEKIKALARELGEDLDALLALAGKISGDLKAIIEKRPQLFSRLIRELKDMPDHAVIRLVREVRDGKW